jgi:hypothetical protein
MNEDVWGTFMLIALGVVLIALNIRNTMYIRDWWLRSDALDPTHPDRSWLLRALMSGAAATTIGVFYFLEVTAISTVLGPQPQLRPLSTFVLVILLLQFWKIGREFRSRYREAELHARAMALEKP